MLATRGSFCARRPGLSLNNLCFVFVNYGTKINLINGWKPSTLRDSWQGRSKKKKVLMKTIKKLKKREKTITCVHDVWAIRNRSESLTRRRACPVFLTQHGARTHRDRSTFKKKKKERNKIWTIVTATESIIKIINLVLRIIITIIARVIIIIIAIINE